MDGDGCSSSCKVEPGFSCTPHPNTPDTCVDITPPTATLKLDNTLVITFSETVRSKAPSDLLAQTMELTLNRKCTFTWTLQSLFPKDSTFDELRIEVYPECSLQKGETVYTVMFKQVSLVVDLSGNALATSVLRVKTEGGKYEISAEARIVGAVIEHASTWSILSMILLSVFQGQAIGSLWHFINMIQVLSYLPLLDCEIPDNFRLILTEYLAIRKLAVPLDKFPAFFNPMSRLTSFITNPFNDKFAELDYESVSFVLNFADELITWLLLGGVYLLLQLLVRMNFTLGHSRILIL